MRIRLAIAIVPVTAALAIAATISFGVPAAYAVNNFWAYEYENYDGYAYSYPCVQGQSYTASNLAEVPDFIHSVINNCEYRVYLQYQNGTSNCISPHTQRSSMETAFTVPDSVKIGYSTNACP
jgi:hypothetical protein